MFAVIVFCSSVVSQIYGRAIDDPGHVGVATFENPSLQEGVSGYPVMLNSLLGTRRNLITRQLSANDFKTLQLENFDPRLQTEIYAHGFAGNEHGERAQQMQDDLRTEEDCNIRRKIIDVIENEVASADLREVIKKFIMDSIAKDVEIACQGIKFNLGELHELYGGGGTSGPPTAIAV